MGEVLRGKGSCGSLHSSSAPQYLGAVGEFYGESFPTDGAELCQFYLVLEFRENPRKVEEGSLGSPGTGSDYGALIFPAGLFGDLLDAVMCLMGVLVHPFDRSSMGCFGEWQQLWGRVGGRKA